MPDWLEDDELDENWGDDPELWQSPTLSGDEVAWAATDDIPLQKPKLSGNVANHITKALAAQATTVWLMNGAGREPGMFADLCHRPDWQSRAQCRGMGTNVFFPSLGVSTAAARAVCASCEVQDECLDAALADETTEGIWGGVSKKARREIRRGNGVTDRCASLCRKPAGYFAGPTQTAPDGIGHLSRALCRLMHTGLDAPKRFRVA